MWIKILSILLTAVLTGWLITSSEKKECNSDMGDTMNNNALIFTISSSKAAYNIGESIDLKATLKNSSKRDISINKKFYLKGDEIEKGGWGVALKITAPGGKLLKIRAFYEMQAPEPTWFIVLKPNETFSENILGDVKEFCEEKGEYKIQAYYYNYIGDDIGVKNAWKGAVPSNIIQITIK